MGLIHSPRIATDGLVLCLDAGNSRSTYLPGSYSNFFDGDGDFITFPANAAFNFGTGSFTIEAWVYLSGDSLLSPGGTRDAQIFDVSTTNTDSLFFLINGNSTTTGTGLIIYNGSVSVSVTTTIPQRQWNHIAVVKSGTSVYFFVNGTQVGTTQTTSGNWGSSTFVPKVGGRGADISTYNFYLNGHISNLRVLKGTALYTSNFTVPTSPLTNIANTSLLTCQSLTFIDNSTNNFAATVNGNTSIQSANPFLGLGDLSGNGKNATLIASPSYNSAGGGNILFNGTTQYATTEASSHFNFGTSNFTISSWIWIDSTAAPTRPFDSLKTVTIFDCGPSNANPTSFAVGGNTVSVGTSIEFYQESPVLAVNIPCSITANAWHQIVWQRSGLTFNGYLDGTSVGSAAITNVAIGGNNPAFIGQSKFTNPTNFKNEFKGYFSSLQIYNRALSAIEIRQNFNTLRGRFGL